MHVMLSVYAKLSSRLLAVQKRERETAHMQGTVYLSKIENKLVSHPMPVC